MDNQEKTRENFYRRMATRLGLELRKSRTRLWRIDDHLQYQVFDPNKGAVVIGEKFELTLDEAASFLEDYEKQLRG